MSDAAPFQHVIETADGLRELYRQPSRLVIDKEREELDAATTAFLHRCRFAVLGTFDADGHPDVSPRGGPSGFVRVLDPGRIAIADLSGNNRLDTLQNVVATGRVGAIFVVPGQSETVRVNGQAWITTDPAVLSGFDLPTVPKAAIGLRVDTTFVHCAKAFMRGGVWDVEAWAALAGAPDGAEILACQQVADVSAATVRKLLDDGYEHDLIEEGSRAVK